MSIHPASRRSFLFTSGALIAWAFMPRIASAAPARDPRFIAIVLRGALDGLAAVAPVGDPDYVTLRQGLVVPTTGKRRGSSARRLRSRSIPTCRSSPSSTGSARR